jgi:tetratricopeptide (TPR) repeat protein
MKKQRLILILLSLVFIAGLYFFGPTVAPAKKSPVASADSTAQPVFNEAELEQQAIAKLNKERQQYLTGLIQSVKRGDVKDQSIHVFHQLASFWKDTVPNPLIHFTYAAKAAELENTEKSLTFAAHSILGYLPFAQNNEEQSFLANRGKDLFDKALSINAANDSSIVGSGACIMFGAGAGEQGIMQGILKVREVAQKDSNNLFAQYMLGVGGMISRQYDKAAARFEKVAIAQPQNLEAHFKLAEAYEMSGNKAKAISWYKIIEQNVSDKDVKEAVAARIKELNK